MTTKPLKVPLERGYHDPFVTERTLNKIGGAVKRLHAMNNSDRIPEKFTLKLVEALSIIEKVERNAGEFRLE